MSNPPRSDAWTASHSSWLQPGGTGNDPASSPRRSAGGTGDEVAQQDRVDRKARAFQLDLGRMDHQYLQQPLAAARPARPPAMHRCAAATGPDRRGSAAHSGGHARMPDIILVAQEQDVGLATHQCIGEIAHIAEIARVLDDLDTDAQRLCAARRPAAAAASGRWNRHRRS
jgi:hypothetical protein